MSQSSSHHQLETISLKNFPNPTTAFHKIELDKVYNNINVRVVNLQGQILQDIQLEQEQNLMIDLSSCSSGIYYVQLLLDGQLATLRVLKQ